MIEIYSKPSCPYCVKAKNLCEQQGYEYTYKMLDEDFTREELFEQFPGARTFPQIKVEGEKHRWFMTSYMHGITRIGNDK